MKKLFTLCTAMLLAAMATAQTDETFQFVDASGNVVSDGSTIVVKQLNSDGQMVIPLWVKNVSEEKNAVSLYETIDQLPNGTTWQTCAFGNCMQLDESGYSPKKVVPADYNESIQTEWIPETGSYATWEAKLQIHVLNIIIKSKFGTISEEPGTEVIGYGPTVTVRFEYNENTTLYGDVNGDKTIDVADISFVISIMAESSNNLKGDVNGDGTVDVADISAIISIMAGK